MANVYIMEAELTQVVMLLIVLYVQLFHLMFVEFVTMDFIEAPTVNVIPVVHKEHLLKLNQ